MTVFDRDLLRAARLDAGLVQDDVAALIGRRGATYARYEQGTIVPNAPALAALADALGVSVAAFFRNDNKAVTR